MLVQLTTVLTAFLSKVAHFYRTFNDEVENVKKRVSTLNYKMKNGISAIPGLIPARRGQA